MELALGKRYGYKPDRRKVNAMQVALTQKWSHKLRNLPESGMGYQCVDVCMRNGTIVKDVLVFNGEQMVWPDESKPIETDDIAEISISDISREFRSNAIRQGAPD